MAAQRTTFEKLQRDRAKKAKAAAKREKRLARQEADAQPEAPELEPLGPDGRELTAAELLQRVEDLHRRFENKELSLEDFEEEKADLMARIPVD